jgi:hypothetical protein
MGVDYERLAFWDELASPTTLLTTLLRVPDTFIDRERLKAALIALDTDLPIGLVVDDIVEGVAERIYWCWMEYRQTTSKKGGPSRELRNLRTALSEWLDQHLDDREGYHLHENDCAKKEALVELLRSTEALVSCMEYEKPKPSRGKQEQPRTTFLRQIYELYVDLKGKPGLSHGGYGPGVQFITECAALVGIRAPEGLRQLILGSVSRARECKDVL